MELSRASGEALWAQVRDVIRAEIVSGAYAAGERLPVERELAERFRVNRLTVRRAMGELQRAGLIDIRQGSGTYVASRPQLLSFGLEHAPWSETSWQSHASHDVTAERLLDVKRVTTPVPVSAFLRAQEVLWVESVAMHGREPWIYMQHWVASGWTSERFRRAFDGSYSSKELPAITGTDLHYAWRVFDAVAAAGRAAGILEVEPGTPLLRRSGVNMDAGGRALMYVQRDALGSRMRIMLENALPE